MSNKHNLLTQAQQLFDNEKYNEVITLLTDEVLDKEKSAELYALRGWAHNRLSGYDKGIEYANKALAQNADYALAYRIKGTALQNKNEIDSALADYNKAIELNPKDAGAYNNRGNLWNDKNEYEKALADYNKAIELDPKDAGVYNNRGSLWKNKKEYRKALADYNKAIELDSRSRLAYRNRGILYREGLENYPLALKDYNKAIELGENDSGMIYWRDFLAEKVKEQEQLQQVSRAEKRETSTTASAEELGEQLEQQVKEIQKLARPNDGETTVHYTKLLVADKILSPPPKDADPAMYGRLRFYNAIYMNDPAEGEFFLQCFTNNRKEIADAFNKGKLKSETSVYLGSFLTNKTGDRHEDDLVMWRTYGKDQHKTEAAGCSFVIKPDFYDKHEDDKEADMRVTGDGSKSTDKGIPQRLYEVIYYKAGRYKHKNEADIEPVMIEIEKILSELIKIQQASEIEEHKQIIDNTIFNALSKISYLFKSADYAFENEVRVIQYMPRGTQLIQTDESDPPKLYVLSNKPLLPYLQKIYIGPKAENPDHWSAYLDFRIQQHRDKITGVNPYQVPVQKSTCVFR